MYTPDNRQAGISDFNLIFSLCGKPYARHPVVSSSNRITPEKPAPKKVAAKLFILQADVRATFFMSLSGPSPLSCFS
jgi:hypothetical protein